VLLVIHVLPEAGDRPEAGTPVVVEVRDVTYADADSVLVASAVGSVGPPEDPALTTVEIEVPEVPGRLSVWAHADVGGTGRVSQGDYLTVQSFPVSAEAAGEAPADVSVLVRRV
jgi:hypothetical protein